MVATRQAAEEFLTARRIAVTGVSRNAGGHGSNAVYRRLKERGYDVVAVNPATDVVEGDPSYPDLASVPGGVEAVVIGTRPAHADSTMRECVELGITRVWMHRLFGEGSVSDWATAYGREHGVTVIDGGCPLMFGPTSDRGHKVMCWFATRRGAVPREVA
ncbi:MAG TPA: CoA-binding protein [Nocardioides sp.]|uniref:CoA-binding protein n=1 Tax=Nocardioides sp. TaxID=35761 RepID=UPI002C661E58|nr:CoA-binding protein [Nocardioides sp.]HQR27770.1 CoA-binding protein [Nocardioides sp.]